MSQPNKDNKPFMALIGALVVIFGLILFIIFRGPKVVYKDTENKQTRDSIKMLTKNIEEQKLITDHYLAVADSLKALPARVKIIYREQKRFTSTATINQLDSTIRANTGLSQR
jgi:hypothetical protein